MTTLLLCLIALIVIAVLLVMRQPDRFTITRSALIAASPEAIFPHVNDLVRWGAWSPWARLDPAAINQFEGPQAGVGATLHWSGNHKVGEGTMRIIESEPGERIVLELAFRKPMKATNSTIFTFAPEGAGTRVSWTMTGMNTLLGKAMSLVFNCDKMVGTQFEQGLANLAEVTAKR